MRLESAETGLARSQTNIPYIAWDELEHDLEYLGYWLWYSEGSQRALACQDREEQA